MKSTTVKTMGGFLGFGAEFFQDLSHQNGKLSLRNVLINHDFIVTYLYNLKEFWL